MIKIFSLLFGLQLLHATIIEQFERFGYVEICDKKQPAAIFDSLYVNFDALIDFLQKNPVWAQKLYIAKERFIRSKDRNYYSTDFFGFYDESERIERRQISFYYSTHFHEFIYSNYPELNRIPEITHFFEICFEIQKGCGDLFNKAAIELGLNELPILFKVIKYFPSYIAARPHYDGTAFSLFLDSTDDASLLLSPYKPSFTVADFFSPPRSVNSILLIPGAFLTEFSIYPTPHIIAQNGKVRYAAIAFAMRPNYAPHKSELTPLPIFR